MTLSASMVKELREFADFDNQKQWEIIKKDFTDWEITMGNKNRELSNNELLNRDYYRGRFVNKINKTIKFNWEI